MSRPATPLPAGLGPTFTTGEAIAAGMSRGALQRSSLSTPLRGVRSTSEPVGLAETCRAYSTALHPHHAFSHVTALRLHGVEVPWTLERDDAVHVVLPRRAERPQRPELRAHFCGRDGLSVVELAGIRVTSPAQTWVHLASVLDEDGLVVLGDGLLRRDQAVTTAVALMSLLGRFPGARGVRRARGALGLIRAGTESSMETRTRLVLVRAGLPCPRVNEEARSRSGQVLARPDMSYPDLRIAIEYDGDVHRTDAATWRRDVERRQRLEADGWLIVTATADDVLRQPWRLVSRVERALIGRGADPSVHQIT